MVTLVGSRGVGVRWGYLELAVLIARVGCCRGCGVRGRRRRFDGVRWGSAAGRARTNTDRPASISITNRERGFERVGGS